MGTLELLRISAILSLSSGFGALGSIIRAISLLNVDIDI